MIESERSGGKFISVRILRTTHRQMLDLAGPDLPLEQYLENIINQIACGTPIDNLKQTTSIMQAPLMEITKKLALMTASLQRLTEITLENHRSLEGIRTFLATPPSFPTDGPRTLFGRPDRSGEPPPSWEKTGYSPHLPESSLHPMSSPAANYDDSRGDDLNTLEANIQKYEEENPW